MSDLHLCSICSERLGIARTKDIDSEKCYLCKGIFEKIPDIAQQIENKLNGFEFKTYAVGARLSEDFAEREDELRSELKIRGTIPIKKDFVRRLSNALSNAINAKVELKEPDVTVLVDLKENKINIYQRPLYYLGRYTKPEGIRQRRKKCSLCNGSGCVSCEWKGDSEKSVESLLSEFFLNFTGGKNVSFTWSGSEGKESVVAFPGRPFVAKVSDPKKRNIPENFELEAGTGKVTVNGVILKRRPVLPRYVITTRVFLDKINEEYIRTLSDFFNKREVIVTKDTGKKLRRKIYCVKTERPDAPNPIIVQMDNGISIKSLVQGGTVEPSFSEILKVNLNCLKFDIVKIQEVGEIEFATVSRL